MKTKINLNYLVILIIIFTFVGCKKNHIYYSDYGYLKEKIVEEGDIDSYNKLINKPYNDELSTEQTYYSMIMALKYNYKPAFINAIVDLKAMSLKAENEKLDERNDFKELLYFFVKKSIEKGDTISSRFFLEDSLMNYPFPNESERCSLIVKAKKNLTGNLQDVTIKK